ncbi:MAG: YraN family protein [Actinomycetota bacterium]
MASYRARQARGRFGEDLAAREYQRRGYAIADRNWRTTIGELDLVVRSGDTVVFVEVKARASDRFGRPELAVGAAKQRRIRRLAAAWMRAHCAGGATVRFDVVAVTGGRIEVFTDAF